MFCERVHVAGAQIKPVADRSRSCSRARGGYSVWVRALHNHTLSLHLTGCSALTQRLITLCANSCQRSGTRYSRTLPPEPTWSCARAGGGTDQINKWNEALRSVWLWSGARCLILQRLPRAETWAAIILSINKISYTMCQFCSLKLHKYCSKIYEILVFIGFFSFLFD